MKDKYMTVRLDEATRERLRVEAEKKGMNSSTLIRVLILKYFEKGEL